MLKQSQLFASRTKVLVAILFLSPTGLLAHGTEKHDPGINLEVDESEYNQPFPIEFGGAFELIDHNGNRVTDESFRDRHMLVFFGYASCKIMCSISLKRIGEALELLGDTTDYLAPLVITVDPERDTPAVMKTELAKYHPDLIGLTGNAAQLMAAYESYKIKPEVIEDDWEGEPIISHSSYIYLMNEKGEFTTLFPPVLSPESMARVIRKHVNHST